MHEIVEVTGEIRWFDAARGYGFISPDGGGDEVLIHLTCLRASGRPVAQEGTRVRVKAMKRPKGLQASEILDWDESGARPRPAAETHHPVQPTSDWCSATVKWFNRVRGFGFLTLGDGSPDLFVHMEVVRACQFTGLEPGQRVQIRWGEAESGRVVGDMRPE